MGVFKDDFIWGVAASAAQIEGAWLEDGKTPSMWDEVSPRRIKDGSNCHVACDHYHRYKEDVALMKSLGVKAYRFSISWPRVMPEDGKPNPKGIAFYSNLVDELLANGIEPIATLFHWDIPMWAVKQGGWKVKSVVQKFAEYTRVVVEALSDRVKYWIPMNEPECFVTIAHLYAVHAPFQCRVFDFAKITRIALEAHAESIKTIRKYAKQKPIIGLALSVGSVIPKDESEKEIEKARKSTFYGLLGHVGIRYFCDPMLLGKPAHAYGVYRIRKKDIPKVKADVDFIGVNIYQPYSLDSVGGSPDDPRRTTMRWLIDGRTMYWTLRFFHERYNMPMFVTENGMANRDVPVNGRVDDKKRIAFMEEYLSNLKRAVSEGIPVMGYLHWSMLDNFEWCEGYTQRFGLTYVDYPTGTRILKDSAFYYKDVIASNGENIK